MNKNGMHSGRQSSQGLADKLNEKARKRGLMNDSQISGHSQWVDGMLPTELKERGWGWGRLKNCISDGITLMLTL